MISLPFFACLSLLLGSPETPIYFVRGGDIYRHDSQGDKKIVANGDYPSRSPDGKKLAFIRNTDLFVMTLASGRVSRKTHFAMGNQNDWPAGGRNGYPSWDPSGRCILCSRLSNFHIKVDPVSDLESTSTIEGSHQVWRVANFWLKPLYMAPRTEDFFTRDYLSSNMFVASEFGAAYSPDGRKIAFCENGDLWMASLFVDNVLSEPDYSNYAQDWEQERVLACAALDSLGDNYSTFLFRISWSPNGSKLALYSNEYKGGVDKFITVVDAAHPKRTIAEFPGADAFFTSEDRLVYWRYDPEIGSCLYSYSLKTKKETLIVKNATDPG